MRTALALTVLLVLPGSPGAWAAKPAPRNTSPPSISGDAVIGQTLTANPGSWTGGPTYAYRWQRCDAAGAGCADITGATSRTYLVASADVGNTLRVTVTASSAGGTAAAASAPTAVVVAPAPPANTAPPTISGSVVAGQALTANPGSWTGTEPIDYAYQWQRYDAATAAWTGISGAMSSTYTLADQDVGTTVRVGVTATNLAGSAAAFSAPTADVQSAPAGSDPIVATAGDIACDPANANFNGGNGTSGSCRQLYTSNLLVNAGLAGVLALGDNQYYCGGLSAFQQSYGLSWGRVKGLTHPSVGNHEYLTSGGTGCDASNAGASGYFDYFGSAAGTRGQGWYSFDVGSWHLIALNSNCGDAGGCGPTSPQGQWLQSDLATHTNPCTLAYWHIPLFSSGGRASPNTQSFWNALYASNADVILSAHDHIYERFAPQTPTGTRDDQRGIRQFIAGTGGANHTSLATVAANSESRDTTTYGVLELTLHSSSYDWTFVPEAGGVFKDAGSGTCH